MSSFATFDEAVDSMFAEAAEFTRTKQLEYLVEQAKPLALELDRILGKYFNMVYSKGFAGNFRGLGFQRLTKGWREKKVSWGGTTPSYYRGEGYWRTGEDPIDDLFYELKSEDPVGVFGRTQVRLFVGGRQVGLTSTKTGALQAKYLSGKSKSGYGRFAKLQDEKVYVELQFVPNISNRFALSPQGAERAIIKLLGMSEEQSVKILAHKRYFLNPYLELLYEKEVKQALERSK